MTGTEPEEGQNMTIDEAAKRLSKSTKTITNYLNSGKLQRTKEHGKTRVTRTSVEKLIACRAKPPDWQDTVSIPEACALLGRSPRMITNYFENGKLTRLVINGRARVRRPDIEKLIAEQDEGE